MKIYKIVTDKKLTNCIECPLMGKKLCGKEIKVQTSSSGARVDMVPDERCLIRAAGK